MEDIVSSILSDNKRYSFKELKRKLNIKNDEKFFCLIKSLEDEGKVLVDYDKKTLLSIVNNDEYLIGEIHIDKNNQGIIVYDNNKYYVSSNYLNGAINKDKVIFKKYDVIYNNMNIAEVVKILKRKDNLIVVTCTYKGFEHNKKINIDFDKLSKKYLSGDKILIKINENNEIIEDTFIGRVDDPNIELKTILALQDIPIVFSEQAIEESILINEKVLDSELVGRVDFINDLVFTIDCDDTKDMDDAVSIKMLDNGNYELTVHIAHVSHYIKRGSELYNEAFKRGNSSYLIDTVNPMIPHKLSNGICSLNEKELRLTRSTIMEIDNKGNIVDFKLVKEFIKSNKKMKYSSVNNLLLENIVEPGYEIYKNDLKLMYKLSLIIRKKLISCGLLEFENDEIKSVVDKYNNPLSFEKRTQQAAEKIIEMFMIYTNICNGKFCEWNNLPTIYRVHEKCNDMKLDEVLNYLKENGYVFRRIKNYDDQYSIQKVLKDLEKYENFSILSNLILKCMSKAYYSSDNSGHSALGLDTYLHSTSPIRRIADLEHQYSLDQYDDFIETGKQIDFDAREEEVFDVATKASEMEIKSDKAALEANKYMMASFMSNHIHEKFTGIITSVNRYGIIVKCDNNIYGKVDYKDLYYNYNTKTANTFDDKLKYKIGDKVILEVDSVSKEKRAVYFKLIGYHNENDINKVKKLIIN